MSLPEALRRELETRLGPIVSARPVGGGCISNTTQIQLADGRTHFLKYSLDPHDRARFRAEASDLEALHEAGCVRVPRVLRISDEDSAWLLLEWLEPAVASSTAWAELGAALAALHRCSNDRFGRATANFIGSLPQSNTWTGRWSDFWRDQRLRPQFEMARERGALAASDGERIEALLRVIADFGDAGDEDGPSLLHGDLWSGNTHPLAEGGIALIDPSSYYGHREVDLAMARLFGGFHEVFFRTYEEAWPLLPGARERCELYQLYYLLVHVNLFGGSYLGGVRGALERLGF